MPVSLYLGLTHASAAWVFITACLAILPLAGLMGEATEHLTHHTGPGIGGLLNASFGNAAELIIAFTALRAGQSEIVKASLTGSIIGNLLMVLGLAMLLGGWRHQELRFSRLAAESGSSMMILAVVALVIPAIYAQVTHHREPQHIESISFDISWVLILTYAASLVFSLSSNKHMFAGEGGDDAAGEGGRPWSVRTGLIVLLAAAQNSIPVFSYYPLQVKKSLVGNGMATAILFAREGAKVVLVNRSAERAEKLAKQIREEGGEAAVFEPLAAAA